MINANSVKLMKTQFLWPRVKIPKNKNKNKNKKKTFSHRQNQILYKTHYGLQVERFECQTKDNYEELTFNLVYCPEGGAAIICPSSC